MRPIGGRNNIRAAKPSLILRPWDGVLRVGAARDQRGGAGGPGEAIGRPAAAGARDAARTAGAGSWVRTGSGSASFRGRPYGCNRSAAACACVAGSWCDRHAQGLRWARGAGEAAPQPGSVQRPAVRAWVDSGCSLCRHATAGLGRNRPSHARPPTPTKGDPDQAGPPRNPSNPPCGATRPEARDRPGPSFPRLP